MKKLLLINLSVLLSFQAYAYKIIVVSDLNGSYGSTHYSRLVSKAIAKIIQLKPDIVLSTGDMVAGQKKGLNYSLMWSKFHETVTIPFKKNNIIFAPAVGNHDGSAYANYDQERKIFIKEWNHYKPKLEYIDSEFYPLYYSFKVSDIFFMAIDSTLTSTFNRQQLNWLKEQLKQNSQYPVKIIFGHVPYFSIVESKNKMNFDDPEFINILNQYHVNLFLTGHQHVFYPAKFEETIHISQSCLGDGARKIIGEEKVSEKSFTIIDIDKKNEIKISTLKSPEFNFPIDSNSLPNVITTDKGTLEKRYY